MNRSAEVVSYPSYRFVLAGVQYLLGFIDHFVMLIPALFIRNMATDFGIAPEHAGAAMGFFIGLDVIAIAVFALWSGPLGHVIGFRRCSVIAVLIRPITLYLTGLAPDYTTASVIRFLGGFSSVFGEASLMPILRTWFPHKEYGRVNGVLGTRTSAGILLFFALTPLLFPPPLWRECYIAYATISVIATILWITLGRGPLRKVERKGQESYFHLLKTNLPKILRTKEVLLMGGVMLIPHGVGTAMSTWFPFYLREELGWARLVANRIPTVSSALGLIGLPLGGVLSDRIGRRRPFLMVGGVMAFLSMFMAVTFVGPATWFLYGSYGFFSALFGFSLGTVLMEHPDIGFKRFPFAISLAVNIGLVGGIIMPPIYGAVLDLTGTLYWIMALGSALYILVSVFGLLSRETGLKASAPTKE